MRPLEVGTLVHLRRRSHSSDRDTVLATLETARVKPSGRTMYTFRLGDKQHWRVLSAFEIDKQIVSIVSQPGRLAA